MIVLHLVPFVLGMDKSKRNYVQIHPNEAG